MVAEVVGSDGKHLGSSKNVRKQRVLTVDKKTGWWDESRTWTGLKRQQRLVVTM
jgi:hypothetical protein